MIIAISGSVGSGKTTIAKELAKRLGGFEVVHLNDWAMDFKIEDVDELQTFDFNIDGLIAKVNRYIADNFSKNMIFEGHFAHFINPDLVDFLFVINRDIKKLREEYVKRGYNEQKIKDNLEVESFNLCFYEAVEGNWRIGELENWRERVRNRGEGVVFAIDNEDSLKIVIEKITFFLDTKR